MFNFRYIILYNHDSTYITLIQKNKNQIIGDNDSEELCN